MFNQMHKPCFYYIKKTNKQAKLVDEWIEIVCK